MKAAIAKGCQPRKRGETTRTTRRLYRRKGPRLLPSGTRRAVAIGHRGGAKGASFGAPPGFSWEARLARAVPISARRHADPSETAGGIRRERTSSRDQATHRLDSVRCSRRCGRAGRHRDRPHGRGLRARLRIVGIRPDAHRAARVVVASSSSRAGGGCHPKRRAGSETLRPVVRELPRRQGGGRWDPREGFVTAAPRLHEGEVPIPNHPEGSLPCDADLMRTLTVGVLPSRMPSFGFLAPADRWALVDEVKRLSAFYDDDEKKSLNHFELNPPTRPSPSMEFLWRPTPRRSSAERWCSSKGECWKCHGKEGLGDGPSAPTLVAEEGSKLPAANLRRGPAGLKSVADAKDVFRVLNLGISGTPMPSYAKSLTADELGDLAAYTASLWAIDPEEARTISRHGSVMPTARESQRTLGETTFLANCAGCHGKLGRGDGVAAAGFMVRPANLAAGITKFKTTPEGKDPTPEDWKRTLRRGIPGSSMPAWGLHSEAEVDAVVSYLSALGGSRSPKGRPSRSRCRRASGSNPKNRPRAAASSSGSRASPATAARGRATASLPTF